MSFLCSSLSSQENGLLDAGGCVSRIKQQHILTNSQNFSMDLRMPGVVPTKVSLFLKVTHPLALRVVIHQASVNELEAT